MKINISKKIMVFVSVSVLLIVIVLFNHHIFSRTNIKEGLSREGKVIRNEIKEIQRETDKLLKLLQKRRDEQQANRGKVLTDLLGDMNDKIGDLEIDPEMAKSYKRYANACIPKSK